MNRKILIIFILICTIHSSWALAQDADVNTSTASNSILTKSFVNSVFFGTGAGLLLGFVLGGLGGLARGASLGLYGGIILGWYVNSDHGSGNGQATEISPPQSRSSPQLEISYNF